MGGLTKYVYACMVHYQKEGRVKDQFGGHQYIEHLIVLEQCMPADSSGLSSHPALHTDHTLINISAGQQALINQSD